MSDIVERLRNWRTVHLTQLRYVMESAAAEIERLRKAPCPHVVGTTTQHCSLTPLTLTDAERKAITEASDFYIGTLTGVTLRGLLERTLAAVSSDCADR
jgi:hypothetical protein